MANKNPKPQIVGFAEGRIQQLLRDSSIRIDEIFPNSRIYQFVNGKDYDNFYDSEEHLNGLIPFKVVDYIYWLSVLIDYTLPNSTLKQINLGIYDTDKNKLFKAEWASNSHLDHAQPHWHINNRNYHNEEINGTFLKPELNSTFEMRLSRIHFPMCASWQKDSSHVAHLSKTENMVIVNWLERVIKYILTQLTWLEDKTMV